MRRRLRKKKHLGEFQVLCFRVAGITQTKIDENELADTFIDFVESNKMRICGSADGWRGSFEFYVSRNGGSCTNEDREAVRNWFMGRSVVISAECDELIDAYYDE